PLMACDEDGAVHRRSLLAEVDQVRDVERRHIVAAIVAATGPAKRFVQVRRMFARRNPHGGAVFFGVQRGRTGNLADVADCVFVRGGEPVIRLPTCGVEVRAIGMDERRNVLGIERVAMCAAIGAPQMVVVDFGDRVFVSGRLGQKDLPVDGAVFALDCWCRNAGQKLCWQCGAIVEANVEGRQKLLEQALLESVVEAVVVGVWGRLLAEGRGGAESDSCEEESSHDCWMRATGCCGLAGEAGLSAKARRSASLRSR